MQIKKGTCRLNLEVIFYSYMIQQENKYVNLWLKISDKTNTLRCSNHINFIPSVSKYSYI
jgi:hypothetical protein